MNYITKRRIVWYLSKLVALVVVLFFVSLMYLFLWKVYGGQFHWTQIPILIAAIAGFALSPSATDEAEQSFRHLFAKDPELTRHRESLKAQKRAARQNRPS